MQLLGPSGLLEMIQSSTRRCGRRRKLYTCQRVEWPYGSKGTLMLRLTLCVFVSLIFFSFIYFLSWVLWRVLFFGFSLQSFDCLGGGILCVSRVVSWSRSLVAFFGFGSGVAFFSLF